MLLASHLVSLCNAGRVSSCCCADIVSGCVGQAQGEGPQAQPQAGGGLPALAGHAGEASLVLFALLICHSTQG